MEQDKFQPLVFEEIYYSIYKAIVDKGLSIWNGLTRSGQESSLEVKRQEDNMKEGVCLKRHLPNGNQCPLCRRQTKLKALKKRLDKLNLELNKVIKILNEELDLENSSVSETSSEREISSPPRKRARRDF